MPIWEDKLREHYPGVNIDKSLAVQQEVKRLPRFVSEWLVARFCPTGVDEENLNKLAGFVSDHLPEKRKKEKVKADLIENGEYTLIDEYRVRADLDEGKYHLEIPCLDIRNARVTPAIVREHDLLLIENVWGVGRLAYNRNAKTISMNEFKPIQISNVDLGVFSEVRKNFSLDEWLDLLVSSIGLNPEVHTKRQKWLVISRLIPLAEENVNLIELAPKGTGKTYLYRHISYHSRVISGGAVSPAVLFYNLSTRTPGLLARNDCIAFDEVQNMRLKDPEEMVGKLKDFMESGIYDRGDHKVASQASIIFLGNLPVSDGKPSEHEVFNVLPQELYNTALIDRLNGFIPGWELDRIQRSDIHLTPYHGLAADYMCEVMHELRAVNFQRHVRAKIKLTEADRRDEESIIKTASGLLKIVAPDEELTPELLDEVMRLAVEYRQRVIDQLNIMEPGEFKPKKLGFDIV